MRCPSCGVEEGMWHKPDCAGLKELTYVQAVQDIVAFVGMEDTEKQGFEAAKMTFLASNALMELAGVQRGYIVLTMFVVAFTEMRKVLAAAKGQDAVLIKQVMEATIGSFGRTVQ